MDWIKELEVKDGCTYPDYIFLYALVGLLRPKRIAEVGTNVGGSSTVMAKAIQYFAFPGQIWTVDPNEEYIQRAEHLWIQNRVRELIHSIKGTVTALVPSSPFDLVFIDGDHSYEGVMKDVSMLRPRSRLLLLHDPLSVPDGVGRACAELGEGVLLKSPPAMRWVGGERDSIWQNGFYLLKGDLL